MKLFYLILSLLVFNYIHSQEIETKIFNHTNKEVTLDRSNFENTERENFTIKPNQEKTIQLDLGNILEIPLKKKFFVGLDKEKTDNMPVAMIAYDITRTGSYVAAQGPVRDNKLNLHIYDNMVYFRPKK